MYRSILPSFLCILFLTGCQPQGNLEVENSPTQEQSANTNNSQNDSSENGSNLKIATFAGGCFWCVEKPFDNTEGVIEAISGYTGGELENPTYEQVSSGKTKHVEAVQVKYNPHVISYKELLEIFWHQINPTDAGGQFADRGYQYTTSIFYHNEEQKKIAEESKKELEESGKFDEPIATRIEPAQTFYKAEEYHQDFYKKDPERYNNYHYHSGRQPYIEKVWGEEE